ncbi:hypothetical protein CRYUN_Cryun34aG0105100 [Craigia yunnanensis]
MEGMIQDPSQQPQQQNQVVVGAERLNQAVQQQLNLESLKTRAISRILEDFDAYSRTNTTPKWQDILGQYSKVNLELSTSWMKSKRFPRLSLFIQKMLMLTMPPLQPEMKVEDNLKREQLLLGMQNLPIPSKIDKLKGQAAKIQEQENLLCAAVNFGEGLRLPADQKQITPSLPLHLADIMPAVDGVHSFADPSGMYMKNTPLMSNNIGGQGSLLQNQLPLHDLQGQTQQKFQSGRQLPPGHVRHGKGQSQLNQGNQLTCHLGQFSSPVNAALFNAAQVTPSTQMIPNMSATMSSQSLLPRIQVGLPGSNPQRSQASQILSDQT